jgi:hypothetical protein
MEEVQPLGPEMTAIQLQDPVSTMDEQDEAVDLALTMVVFHTTP